MLYSYKIFSFVYLEIDEILFDAINSTIPVVLRLNV